MWLCNYCSNASVSLLHVSVALQVVGKDYFQEEAFQIKFEDSEISLDIPKNGEKTEEGWRITPYTHPLVVNTVILSLPLHLCLAMHSVTSYYALSVNLYPHQISKKDVDNFKPSKRIPPPKCVLFVEWDLEGQKPARLRYTINFVGAKPNFLNLSLNPTWKGNIPLSCGFIALQCLCFLPFCVDTSHVGLIVIRGLNASDHD